MAADHSRGGEGTDGGRGVLPPTLVPPDLDTLVLCQMAGLDAPLLRQLLARWETPAAILQAPSAALRRAGLAPALVARIVAAPRQRATAAAGLQSLTHLGIVPLPLLAPAYPARLRESPAAPTLLYVQGRWPPPAPMVGYLTAGTLDDAGRAEVTALLAALQARGLSVLATGADLTLLPAAGSIGVLAAGLLVARPQVPEGLRTSVGKGAATLLSVAPLTAEATPALEGVAAVVLQALADGLVVAGTAAGPAPSRPDLHQWQLSTGGAANVGHATWQIRGGPSGAERIARALGLQEVGTARVQQERFW